MSELALKNTIYALASAAGRAGVSVVRVSGPQAFQGLQALTSRSDFKPRVVSLAKLRHPMTHEILDEALVLLFHAPASYTGEDVVEYHLHGGRAVLDSVFKVLSKQDGYRLAEPGEFTRRAFENGRMDLTAAEAVADLIDAETDAQRVQALEQMGGALSRVYNDWSERLRKILAHIEADIEFPDEDLPEGVASEAIDSVKALTDEIAEYLDDHHIGERLREGIHIAILGAPNAGKSSLMNALVRRDVAIVSNIAGTTRDVIEAHLNIRGYPVILSDTAGLRPDLLGAEGQEGIEAEGIRRAIERADRADLTILLFDGTEPVPDSHTLNLIDGRSILVVNKMDDVLSESFMDGAIPISVKTGGNLNLLMEVLQERLSELMIPRETPSLTRKRHREALEEALQGLQRASLAVLPELVAEDLRLAMRSIGRITGRTEVEDLLDVIFRDFCLGK